MDKRFPLFRQVGLVAFVILILTAIFVFTSCVDCSIYGFPAVKIIYLSGMIFCLLRLIVVISYGWKSISTFYQTFVPLFVLAQLVLLFVGKITSPIVLLLVGAAELLIVIVAFFLIKSSVSKDQNLQSTIIQILGFLLPTSIQKWVTLEVSLLSSALYGVSKLFIVPEEEGWSYWKNSAFPLIFIIVFFIGPVELIVFKYVLNIESAFAHSLLALFYVWAIIYVYGFWVSIKRLPHQINEEEVVLNRGLLETTKFQLHSVEAVKVLPPELIGESEKIDGTAYLTVPGSPLVQFILKGPVEINRLIGAKQLSDKIVVSVDDPQRFCEEILRKDNRN
ncbi:MAG: hypothetical protein ACKVQW_14930 [Pyrinomonadaceae bacterium]